MVENTPKSVERLTLGQNISEIGVVFCSFLSREFKASIVPIEQVVEIVYSR